MCPPDLRRANDDEDESSRRRALRATATFGATVRDSSGGGGGETAPRKSRRECHVAVVVDVSRECLSEDCRGGFDSAGNATRVTRLRAMCVAARALASGADSACAFVSEASSSENGRSERSPSRHHSRRGENRAVFVATNKRETRDALESLERTIHDAAASPVRTAGASRDDALVTKEGPRTTAERRSREELLPNGAPLPTALRLAAMALRRMSPSGGKNARATAVAASPDTPPPRRSILVLLASDGVCRARNEKKHIEDIASAIQKLRAFDADAKCHVLRVAPPRDEERFGTLTSAMTKCADCSAREVFEKDGVHDCVSCGTCLTRTRNIVWSAAGFGKTHLARAAFRRRVFDDDDDDDDDDDVFGGDDEKKNVAVAVPETTTDTPGWSSSSSSSSSFSSSSPTPSARVGGVCGTDHAAALEVLSAGFFSRAEVEARLESAQRESATLAVETRRVVAVEDEDKNTFLRVERCVARFHAEDIPPTVAALTSPLASVRAGRLLETRAGKGKTETLRLSPESLSAVHPLRAARFDERLELWLEVDGALRVVHVRDENRTDTLARIGAGAADALRRLAAATRELEARRTENASQARVAESEKKPKPRATMDDDDARRRRVISHPLPNDASRRAFRLIAGTGAGSRASYFWLRDARVEDGARALASFAEKLRNPPTLSDATRVPPERLEALASAAPALGEIASSFPGFANRESIAQRVASLARDVKRVEAERARREEADARARRVERARRETKKNSLSRKKLDEKKKERDASSSETRLEARARAALIATRVFGEASAIPPPREPRPERETRPEPEPTTAPALEPSGRGAAATGQSGANKKRGLCARTSAASVPLPPGARVTAANVASLFATEVVQSGDAESDEETRERERR